MKITVTSSTGEVLFEREIPIKQAGVMFPGRNSPVSFTFMPSINDELVVCLHDIAIFEIELDKDDEDAIREFEQDADAWRADMHVQ